MPVAKSMGWIPDLPAVMSGVLNRYMNKYEVWLLKNADALIFQSKLSQDMYREHLYFRSSDRPEALIFNGVDLDEFHPRDGAKLDGIPAVIISAAIYRLHKRLGQAIQLINRLAADYPRIRLHVLGAFDPLVKETVSALDTSRCVFHGRMHPSDLATYYGGADIQFSLAVFDPCPNVVCEGLASGLPVLTPVESGAAELIGPANQHWAVSEGISLRKFRSSFVADAIPPLPVERYVDAFRLIMDGLAEHRRRARARAEAVLDIRTVAVSYNDFLASAFSSRNVRKPHDKRASP